MELPRRILAFSLLGWAILIFITFLLSIIGFTDPSSAISAVFLKYEITSPVNPTTFGPIFSLWAISASIPISVIALSSSPILIESILPFILILIGCGILGYMLEYKKGITSVFLLVAFGIAFGVILAFLVPLTLPTAALSPEDQTAMQGIGGDFAKLTLLMPINLLLEFFLTVGLCLSASLIGGLTRQKLSGKKIKRRKKTKKK